MYRGMVEGGPLGDRQHAPSFFVMMQPERLVTCCVGPRGLRVLRGPQPGYADETTVEYEWVWGIWLCGAELLAARLAWDVAA